ncbi:F-box protein At3g54460-like [Chenopodium quinoa]|uniref:F-box protein At3g54460-like n=1 Tax=Chenopodium quinoa TaxID=63459 RepID=UPI000B78DB59|nr:F-box protein At3g54460-like [Chenopodium quinoa]
MEVEESSIPPNHKLCGFLTTVLSSINPQSKTLEFGNHLQFFSHKSEFGFISNSGVILSPIPYSGHRIDADDSNLSPETTSAKKRKGKLKHAKSPKKNGSVNGNGIVSVVYQLKTLMKCNCLKIVARIVGLSIREEDKDDGCEIRVAVLVDVYLPIELEFGWQFPKSTTTAASLFRHLSCDWRERTLILKDGYCNDVVGDIKGLWNLSDCHVIGCKQHSDISDSSKKKGFEFHEIFKSLPSLSGDVKTYSSRIMPEDMASVSGIWDLTDDIVEKIISLLRPIDIVRVSATCRHLRILSVSIMPCIKLKLFPHQQAAVEWMVQRERKVANLRHPLYLEFLTEDGFAFYINIVSGEIVTGFAPTIKDFCGGMFCDEPGLGKTITALSLILKTQGTLADPPEGAETIWCSHNGDKKYGYYECSTGSRYTNVVVPSSEQKSAIQGERRGQFSPDELIPKNQFTPKRASSGGQSTSSMAQASSVLSPSTPTTCFVPCTRSLNRVKRNLMHTYEKTSSYPEDNNTGSGKRHRTSYPSPIASKRRRKVSEDQSVISNETWIQCDACQKWRRLSDESLADSTTAWFCSLNSDFLYQSCDAPEESWDYQQPVTYLPGFYGKDSTGELPQNVAFFTSVLKKHYALLNCQTKKSLKWLAKLPYDKLLDMETVGLAHHGQLTSKQANVFSKIFQEFGLVRRVVQGAYRWFYPKALKNLVFDLPALRIALCERLDSFRMYLSRATLIIVPSNLVDHWNSQIQKHVKPGQLRVYAWTDLKEKKPSVHNLAWDYDVVITTFSRLSAEWKPSKRSVLMQIHWMRIILDEGHTLGSINLTNKMQMAVSLSASNRWILTGTPTPNTPSGQISHIQPMLKFLHDEVYGESCKNWEAGILKPFEAQMEEGKLRLLQLLERCMISARKADLRCIPPCIKKTTFLEFTEEHAKTYNELVVTVRRNILMADWNDPSHVQSLLNPKHWKSRTNTIRNVRLSCCVAGHMKVSHAGHDIQETMDILVQNGLDLLSEEYSRIRYNLSYGGNCQRCNEWCRLPIVTPCRHLLCLDCVALDSERCVFPGCGYLYEMESPEIRSRQENPNPKWPVPKDLIELQPSYKQDSWDPDWESTSSSKVTYLVQRLKEIQGANRQKDSSMTEENYAERPCDFILSQGPCCKPSIGSSEAPAEKVIVFSQFLEHINVIEHQLAIADIKFAGLYNPLNVFKKKKALTSFQYDQNCMVLVMDGSAALGLDFSFVTHVFLMEPIWDLSMEDQVISRAHRMGAVRPIHVETLVMRGTIEEQMLEFLQNADECRKLLKGDHEKTEHEGARAHRSVHNFAEKTYLVRLSMVRTKD